MKAELGVDQWRGWHDAAFPASSWRCVDGAFEAIADAPRIDLVSRAPYRNFRFEFEFALPAAGNSGVLYRVDETAVLAWHSGPEMQLLDDAGHPDGREPTTCNGALYALAAPEVATPVKPGVFVHGEVRVQRTLIEHWLAGRLVLQADLADPALLARIGRSKFAAFDGFARRQDGHLVLQHHGDAVRFRRLCIEPTD